MRITEYMRSLIKADTRDSSKSFALVVCVLTGALTALVVCFCLVWDVVSNGYVKTDLSNMGIFLLCVGGFMAGGGINKAAGEIMRRKRNPNPASPRGGDGGN